MMVKIKGKRETVKVKNLRVPEAVLHIKGSKNNFMMNLCDPNGNTLKQDTAGASFNGAKKSTPHAANIVSERLARWALDRGVQAVHVRVKGTGVGKEMALRTVDNRGLKVLSAKDVTGIKHGGCKPRKKPRK